MLLLGPIALVTMLCEGAALDWSALYIRGLGPADGIAEGLGYAAFAVSVAAVRMSGARLLDRIRTPLLLPSLAAVATVAMTLALASGRIWAAIIGFGCLGVGTGLLIPTLLTAAGGIRELTPGVAITAVSACGWIGYMSGPPLIGALAQLTSLRASLALIPAGTLLIAVGASRLVAPPAVSAPPLAG